MLFDTNQRNKLDIRDACMDADILVHESTYGPEVDPRVAIKRGSYLLV